MKQLWKDTFHDSDCYINLVFKTYFKPEYVAYKEIDGEVISALLGVPYEFGNGDISMKGLYLCGLATRSEYRRHGIMDSLLEEINDRAANDFAFSFLIPADDGLKKYYEDRGYENGMYLVKDRYTSVHDFMKDNDNILAAEDRRVAALKQHYCEALRVYRFITDKMECNSDNSNENSSSAVEENKEPSIIKDTMEDEDLLIKFIQNCEDRADVVCLRHSKEDLHAAILENGISGGRIYYTKNRENEVTGVVFVEDDSTESVKVKKIYNSDRCSFYKLLDAVKKTYADRPIVIYSYPENINRKELWMLTYGATDPDAAIVPAFGQVERVYDVANHARPYGMIRFLNVPKILQFLAQYRRDCKFNVLVKTDSNNNWLYCKVNNGTVITEPIKEAAANSLMKITHATPFSMSDLEKVICRRSGNNSLLMEAFGIPRLPLNMCLLLD